MSFLRRVSILALAAVSIAGCTPVKPQGRSPLTPAQMSPETVVLEMFFVRCGVNDPRANTKVWEQVDEQVIAGEARRVLARNGFRAGVIAGPLPTELSQLMELKGEPVRDPDKANAVDLQTEPRVLKRHLQLRAGQPSQILASPVYDEWPVLIPEGDQVSGHTYRQAQGLFELKASQQRDGRVRLELLPQLSYGEVRQHWVGNQGMLRLEASRPKRAFSDMRMEVTLTAGHLLMLAALPQRPGSLGNYFFSDNSSGQPEQKLLLIRLIQTQHDDLLPPPEILPLDTTVEVTEAKR